MDMVPPEMRDALFVTDRQWHWELLLAERGNQAGIALVKKLPEPCWV